MKKQLFFTLLFFTSFLFAQIPAYYNDVNLNLSGTSLKDELATKIISTHTNYLSYSEIWYASRITDLDPNDASNSNVLLIYGYDDNDGNYRTDRTRSKFANGGNNGTDWNREHVYAKSLGTPSLGTSGPGSDAHHLRPADATWNSTRGSKKFAQGSGHSGAVANGWYPGDEWKGDVARMMMYMYLRYGNQCKPTNVGVGNASNTPDDMIDLFLQWNAEDPVSQLEINRNNYHGNTANTYAQGNRNPFIDNPAFATQIWGGPQAEDRFGNSNNTDTQAPSTPNGVTASTISTNGFTISWNAATDNIGVTDYDVYLNNNYYDNTSALNYSFNNLNENTNYTVFIQANDAAGNTSNASAAITVTTLSVNNGGGNGSNLFFSEYIEGSSYNKALEIANTTANTINLSNYSIKKQSNGSGGWSSGYTLSGQLSSGDVFVIANTNASTNITSIADITTTASELSFNGNDPIGLFKNDVLIDVIGDFNSGSAYFAKDVTLQRNSDITQPTTAFEWNQWTELPKNTFDDLGYFSASSGGSTTADTLIETSFESGWDGWLDGGGDCYRIKSPSKASDGSYSIRLRDNSGTASSMTYSNLDVSNYQNLQINFDFYSYSMETGEDFWVQFYDGYSWNTIATYISGTDFYNNEFTSESIVISANNYNFSSNSKLRIQCDASSNYDQIYIDNVIVSASTGALNKSNNMRIKKSNAIWTSSDLEVEGLSVYPNPTKQNAFITLQTVFDLEGEQTNVHIQLFDIRGRLVKQLDFTGISNELFEQKIAVSNLEKGIYLLQITNTKGYKEVKKILIN